MIMKRILNSKEGAWVGFVLVLVYLVVSFKYSTAWWGLTDVFFFFMATFSHLIAVNLRSLNPYVSKKLDVIGFWMMVLGIIALIGEVIAWQVI